MPLDTATTPVARTGVQLRDQQVVFAPGAPGGTLTVNQAFAEPFARVGLNTASGFLDLPGEVVSGHPDRHVARVEVPGAGTFYLKRQHVVGWREKFRTRLAGYGWASRCEREACLLQQLESAQLPAPRWAAFGTHGSRAFLLVEAVPGAIDLRHLLSDTGLSFTERRALAVNLGAAIAAVHTAGFTTPDLTAKHVLVNPQTLAVTFLDWQSARQGRVSRAGRAEALGALHASLAGELASHAERMRVLRVYLSGERRGVSPSVDCVDARLALRAASRHAGRRSVRDQLRPESPAQRLVWLAGEAVCVVPEMASAWPRPVIGPPFYGFGTDGTSQVRFAGHDAILVRGCSFAPLGRVRARLRAIPWRSPGVTIGRVLFHLERYGIPAPRLFAFGQRFVSSTSAEWFALHAAPSGIPLRAWRRTAPTRERRAALIAATECLNKLHAAGCVLTDAKAAFALNAGRISIADPCAVRIVKRVSASAQRRDLRTVTQLLRVA